MDNNSRKTTDKDFKFFQKRCLYWQKYLCPEFKLYFLHTALENSNAQVRMNKNDGIAEVALGVNIDKRTTINECAFHEMCELMLCRIYNEACAFLSSDYVTEITHEIVRKLENLIFGGE